MIFTSVIFDSALGTVGLLLAVLATCAITYFLNKRRMEWEIEVIRAEISDRLANALEEIELAKEQLAPVAKPTPPVVEMPKPASPPKPVVVPKPAPQPAQPEQASSELAHETLVVIAAAVAAYLGKSVRLRSARLIEPVVGNPWAQQGRVFVQASHNLGLAQRAHG